MGIGTTDHRALFNPGVIVTTPGAIKALSQDDVLDALVRHFGGDWGDLNKHDWQTNDRAIDSGDRILSQYFAQDETKFYIITEHDRSVTTILLPEEY